MNYRARTIAGALLLLLYQLSCFITASGQTPAGPSADRARVVGSPQKAGWERIYSEEKTNFKTIYSSPLPSGNWASARWLLLGDDKGFVRLGVFDSKSSILLGPDNSKPDAPYFALSKLTVDAPNINDPQSRQPINALYFANPDVGYLLKGNRLYSTESGGLSWRLNHYVPSQPDKSAATLLSMAITPSKHACMVGMYSQPNEVKGSLVWCTEKRLEGGDAEWKPVDVPSQTQLWHITFLDDKLGLVVGTLGTILKTNDGGRTWKQIPIEAESLLQSYFIDEKNAWIVGRYGTILHSINGGENWVAVKPSFSNVIADLSLKSIKFAPDKLNGWIVGDQGVILHTDDGGATWQLQQPPSTKDKFELNALFIDETFCWAVGSSGNVWRYRLK